MEKYTSKRNYEHTTKELEKEYNLHVHGVLPQEDGGTNFGVMGGHVKLGFEWGAIQYRGAYRKAAKWGDFITFSEEIRNYVEKINEKK